MHTSTFYKPRAIGRNLRKWDWNLSCTVNGRTDPFPFTRPRDQSQQRVGRDLLFLIPPSPRANTFTKVFNYEANSSPPRRFRPRGLKIQPGSRIHLLSSSSSVLITFISSIVPCTTRLLISFESPSASSSPPLSLSGDIRGSITGCAPRNFPPFVK